MLLAILYSEHNCIAGVALACEQQPYASRYWTELYASEVTLNADSETAYLEIQDEPLCQRLLKMANGEGFTDGYKAAAAVEQYLAPFSDYEGTQRAA